MVEIVCLKTLESEVNSRIGELLQMLSKRDILGWQDHLENTLADPNTYIFITKVDGVVAGMVTLNITFSLRGTYGTINDLVVDPEYRGQQLGRQLMEAAHKVGWARNCTHINLTSSPHRKTARHLYQDMGYEIKETGVFRLLRH